jgi:hypothetical protein
MAGSPLDNPIAKELVRIAAKAGAKAAARALDSVLDDGAKVLAEGARRVKKARSRLHRYEDEDPEPPEDDG